MNSPDSKSLPELAMVCGRTIQGDPAYFPQADYQGCRVYFCTEFCLNAFRSDPERFYQAHSRSAGASGPCDYDRQR